MRLRRALAAAAVAALLAGACVGGSAGKAGEGGDANEPAGSPTAYEPVTKAPRGWLQSGCNLPLEMLERIRRGYRPDRSPDVLFVPREPNQFFNNHAGPWDYLQGVPLVLYGPGFIKPAGKIAPAPAATVADLAPTYADLLGIDWPVDRGGRVLEEAIVPAEQRPGPPKLIVTVVWDGGGRFVLGAWPDEWPNLERFMQNGTSFENATAGSSPSVTPPIHANIGTGTYPKEHGVVDIPLRDGDQIVDSWPGGTPMYLDTQTLADLYDPMTNNRAQIGMFAFSNWHLGMIGHGAYLPGGDKDIAVLVDNSGGLVTNTDWYSIPPFLQGVAGLEEDTRTIDQEDGELDGAWMGNDVLDDPNLLRNTPAWVLYQTRVIRALLEGEGFGRDDVADLFYVNYKQIDQIGHHQGMLEPEMGNMLAHTDAQLAVLERFLNSSVGKNAWVMAVTADHGPAPELPDTGGWPLHMQVLRDQLGRHFSLDPDELLIDERSAGFWPDQAVMAEHGITEGDIADFVINYRLEDDVPPDKEMPAAFAGRRRELLFSAAFPADRLGAVWHCARQRQS